MIYKLITWALVFILILLVGFNLSSTREERATSSSENYTEKIFQDLNPMYMKNVRSIKFINYTGDYYGRANQFGDVEINFTGNYRFDRVTVCHELIHTLFFTNNVTIDEQLADNLSLLLVCFK